MDCCEYGLINEIWARRNIKTGKVDILAYRKGEQGYVYDQYASFGETPGNEFKLLKVKSIYEFQRLHRLRYSLYTKHLSQSIEDRDKNQQDKCGAHVIIDDIKTSIRPGWSKGEFNIKIVCHCDDSTSVEKLHRAEIQKQIKSSIFEIFNCEPINQEE